MAGAASFGLTTLHSTLGSRVFAGDNLPILLVLIPLALYLAYGVLIRLLAGPVSWLLATLPNGFLCCWSRLS